jgi:hypothetical protein
LLDLDVHVLALESETLVAEHRPREQTGFEQYLETIAEADHGAAGGSKSRHLVHDGREARNRAGPQVVAVRESAWQHHHVGPFQARLLVPDVLGVDAEDVPGCIVCVVVAVGAGEHNDGEFHATTPSSTSIR